MDGVDVALIETDGEASVGSGRPATGPIASRSGRCCGARSRLPPICSDRAERPGALAEAEELVTDLHAEAVEAFLAANGMRPREVDVVGFHGQTVLHRPDAG